MQVQTPADPRRKSDLQQVGGRVFLLREQTNALKRQFQELLRRWLQPTDAEKAAEGYDNDADMVALAQHLLIPTDNQGPAAADVILAECPERVVVDWATQQAKLNSLRDAIPNLLGALGIETVPSPPTPMSPNAPTESPAPASETPI